MILVLCVVVFLFNFFFFQAEDGIRDTSVTGVQTCALPISLLLLLLLLLFLFHLLLLRTSFSSFFLAYFLSFLFTLPFLLLHLPRLLSSVPILFFPHLDRKSVV